MSYSIVLSRDDTAAFMAAVADLEDEALKGRLDVPIIEAIHELGRVASVIGGQVDAQ